MTVSTPLSLYETALQQGDYQPDEVQRQTVLHLQQLYHALLNRTSPEKSSITQRLLGKFRAKKAQLSLSVAFICGEGLGEVKPG